jgi:hypothetical protein
MSTRADFWYLVSSGSLFGLFVLDVLVGKVALQNGTEPFMKLGDVGEFLALLAAVILFVIEVLRREAEETELKTRSAETAGEGK